MWCVVWFKDGAFVDGRSVASQAEWDEVAKGDEIPDEPGHVFYVLPEAAEKMRREQPIAAVVEALKLMREARELEARMC